MYHLRRWKSEIEHANIWPVHEAKQVLRTFDQRHIDAIILQSGYGPSGFPHIGTIRDIATAHFVGLALQAMGHETDLIVFSDDTDPLTSIPSDIEKRLKEECPDTFHQELENLKSQLGKPLSEIELPLECMLIDGTSHDGLKYAELMRRRLVDILDHLGIQYKFESAKNEYSIGRFDMHICRALEKAEQINEIYREHFKQERNKPVRRTWKYPYFPVCGSCGKIATTRVLDVDLWHYMVEYVCDITKKTKRGNVSFQGCGHHGRRSFLGSNGKLPFTLQWLARWIDWDFRKHMFVTKEMTKEDRFVNATHYEPFGNDLLALRQLADRIIKEVYNVPIGGPLGIDYGLIVDEHNRKFSKSAGASFRLRNFFEYAPNDALLLFLMKDPRKSRKLYIDKIPSIMDEALRAQREWFQTVTQPIKEYDEQKQKIVNVGERKKRQNYAYWFVTHGKPKTIPDNVMNYQNLLSLVACVGERPNVIKQYIGKFYGKDVEQSEELIRGAIAFYTNEMKPKLTEPTFTETEKLFLRKIYTFIDENPEYEELDFEQMDEKSHKTYYMTLNQTVRELAEEAGITDDPIPEGLTRKEKAQFNREHSLQAKAYKALYKAILKQEEGAPFSSMLLLGGKEKILDKIEEHIQ